MEKTRYLILENGQVFEGRSFGAEGEVTGEIVFTTGMTGYLETLTDPSYYGQIVVQTFPLIGNYGVIPEDFESRKPWISAYIVREWCQAPSNFRSEGTVDNFLKEHNVVGVYGLDTRELTKIIRERGVMNACITSDLSRKEQALKTARQYRIEQAVESVTCPAPSESLPAIPRYKVVLWDYGAKENIERELLKRGCTVVRVPAEITAKEILALKPDGVMLSNGPGDPAENTGVIAELSKLANAQVPIFGICLGHQLLALARGARTEKMKYGHRGANQPAKFLPTGRVYITSQNHGYAVVSDSLPDNAELAFVNANDNTCEGVTYTDMPAFTVQFHPEACGGPHDTSFLFDRFTSLMDRYKA